MTTQDIVDYYANLLILQYRGKPRARATVEAVVKPVVMDKIALAVQSAYAVQSAVGVQLDVLGKYVGVSRNTMAFSGPVTLDDVDFRLMIKLKIAQNNGGSSLADIQSLLQMFFDGQIVAFDHQNMHMSYFFDSALGSATIAEVFVRQGLLPKPMGVQVGSLVYAADLTHFFGFRTYERPQFQASPFNTYANYLSGRPWLSYDDAIAL